MHVNPLGNPSHPRLVPDCRVELLLYDGIRAFRRKSHLVQIVHVEWYRDVSYALD